ncbi:FtsX-like permease family protein, partial [Algoriphagus aestuarii]|nr:FtsX-like permease family protein [Algoriphagus aestuarii]
AGVQARIFTTALLLFAAVSVFVAALVIHNTFTILVAQRQRELALLRCVGATRGQVFRAVLVEALVVGMAASAVGVVAGIGLGWGAFALGERFITDSTTSSPLVITAVPIVVGLLVGVLSSVASALHPAV